MDEPAADGWPAWKVFQGDVAGMSTGFAYDDIILMPGLASFEAEAADIRGQVTRSITLHVPFLSSPSATVTEADMAISMALIGGMGVIHCRQTAAAQAEMVSKVKRYTSGFILDPFTLGPENTLADLDKLKADKGVSNVPVTADGKLRGKLVGFVSYRDHELVEDRGTKLRSVMVTQVVTASEGLSLEEAQAEMRKSKMGKLPIVDEEGRLVSMITRKDIKKLRDFPHMSRDLSGKLLVGASLPAQREPDDWLRARALAEAGVDVLFIDIRNASGCDRALALLNRIKVEFPGCEVAVGPVATCREAKRLLETGADALFAVGGAGASGCGGPHGVVPAAVARGEATALFEVARYARLSFGIPTLAGGVRDIGQGMKALSLGASAVLLGEPLAGADEAPGRAVVLPSPHGASVVKIHQGYGAEPELAIRPCGNAFGPVQVFSKVVGTAVSSKGSVKTIIPYWALGVRHGLQDLGRTSILELHAALESGDLRFECRSIFASQSWDATLRAAGPRPLMPAPGRLA